jgi:hypothetical protein
LGLQRIFNLNKKKIIESYDPANSMKVKSDFIFIGALGILIINTITQSILFNYLLSINNYLGFAAWLLILLLRIFKSRIGRYGLGVLLILGLFNIINFTLARVFLTVGFGGVSKAPIETVGLNPIVLLVLIIYYFVNKKSINRILAHLFYGSQEEREREHQKKVDFYLKKFEDCDSNELDQMFNNLKDYPAEAQIALNQIRGQKTITQ